MDLKRRDLIESQKCKHVGRYNGRRKMHLTLNKILEEVEIFADAKLVAGKKGVETVVSWTSISEHMNISEWLQPSTLLLSSGFLLKDEPNVFADRIPLFMEKGLVGLVVTVGSHIKEVPNIVVEQANKYNFPIIILPSTVPLMNITYGIHNKIISLHYELVEASFNIHKTLNNIVIEGGGLTKLAREMSFLIGRSITIEDPELKLLAHSQFGKVDESREKTIEYGKSPSEFVDYLNDAGTLKLMQKAAKTYSIPRLPELGVTYGRVVAPIYVDTQLYGYFWIIADEEPLNDMDYIVIERGVTLASLILSREEAIYRSRQEVLGKLFDSIIDHGSSNDVYENTNRLQALGVDNYYQILLVEHNLNEYYKVKRLNTIIVDIATDEGALLQIFEKANHFVVLLRGDTGNNNKLVANNIINKANESGYELSIGLSDCSNQSSQLNRHYQEALSALKIGKALSDSENKPNLFCELGYFVNLLTMPPEYRSDNKYYGIVEAIADYDNTNGTDYFHTLEVYLDCNSNIQKTAINLFIHRNTLYQRLDKMAKLWNIYFDNINFLLNIHIATKEWRINQIKPL